MISKPIDLTGTRNTRDLGGFTGRDGRLVRKHRLIRSDNLSLLTTADSDRLVGEYHLKRLVDLRGGDEVIRQPDPVIAGVAYTHLPVLRDGQRVTPRNLPEDAGIATRLSAVVDGMGGDVRAHNIGIYTIMTRSPFTTAQYRLFIRLLLNQKEGAVLWHCAAGKDRTGIGAAIILMALGVDPEAVRADYLASNDYLVERIEEIDAMMADGGASADTRREVRVMCRVLPEYWDAAMNGVRDHWGGMADYLKNGLGLCAPRRRALEALYLEDA